MDKNNTNKQQKKQARTKRILAQADSSGHCRVCTLSYIFCCARTSAEQQSVLQRQKLPAPDKFVRLSVVHYGVLLSALVGAKTVRTSVEWSVLSPNKVAVRRHNHVLRFARVRAKTVRT
jgi:hypothetical protein